MSVWLKQLDTGICIDFANSFDSVKDRLSEKNNYDLLMLNLGMPSMQGAFSVRKLLSQLDHTPLIVVSADESPLVIRICLEAGASGYVTKSYEGDTILQAVKQVLSGAEYIPLCARINENDEQFDFNDKQMQLLAEGLANKGIAEKMHLCEGTIKQYVTKLLRTLNIDNRMQAGLKVHGLLGIGGH